VFGTQNGNRHGLIPGATAPAARLAKVMAEGFSALGVPCLSATSRAICRHDPPGGNTDAIASR
jgi:hypothetical protein